MRGFFNSKIVCLPKAEIEMYRFYNHKSYIGKMFDRNSDRMKRRQRRPHPKMHVCFHLIDFNPEISSGCVQFPFEHLLNDATLTTAMTSELSHNSSIHKLDFLPYLFVNTLRITDTGVYLPCPAHDKKYFHFVFPSRQN